MAPGSPKYGLSGARLCGNLVATGRHQGARGAPEGDSEDRRAAILRGRNAIDAQLHRPPPLPDEGSVCRVGEAWRGAISWIEPDGLRHHRVVHGQTQAETRQKGDALRRELHVGAAFPRGRALTSDEFLAESLGQHRARVKPFTWLVSACRTCRIPGTSASRVPTAAPRRGPAGCAHYRRVSLGRRGRVRCSRCSLVCPTQWPARAPQGSRHPPRRDGIMAGALGPRHTTWHGARYAHG